MLRFLSLTFPSSPRNIFVLFTFFSFITLKIIQNTLFSTKNNPILHYIYPIFSSFLVAHLMIFLMIFFVHENVESFFSHTHTKFIHLFVSIFILYFFSLHISLIVFICVIVATTEAKEWERTVTCWKSCSHACCLEVDLISPESTLESQ